MLMCIYMYLHVSWAFGFLNLCWCFSVFSIHEWQPLALLSCHVVILISCIYPPGTLLGVLPPAVSLGAVNVSSTLPFTQPSLCPMPSGISHTTPGSLSLMPSLSDDPAALLSSGPGLSLSMSLRPVPAYSWYVQYPYFATSVCSFAYSPLPFLADFHVAQLKRFVGRLMGATVPYPYLASILSLNHPPYPTRPVSLPSWPACPSPVRAHILAEFLSTHLTSSLHNLF